MFDGVGASKVDDQPTDRREAQRYKLNWPIRVLGGDSFDEVGQLRDIGSIGAYAYFNRVPKLRSELSVWIRLPLLPEIWMSYSAVVVRVEPMTSPIGVALRFSASRPVFERSPG